MSKQSLLLVDGDTRSMRVLEVSLRKAGFTVTTAVSVEDALDKLELHTPDLIISETTFPDADGFELPRRVRATPDWADIPFIFLTAEGSIENKIKGLELGVDDYLTKPIYIKEIVTRINILLQKRQRLRFEERKDGHTRFAGRVADMPVVDVIQTIEISRKSGVIQFVGERGRQATIYFRDGRVIDAEAGALQGEDAIYRLLTWSEGEFEVVFRTVRRREVINTSSQGLLMEGMRRLDEWSRLLEQLPPLTHRFEVDAAELALRLGDVPDDNNSILRLLDGKRTLIEVIDACDIGDLECMQAISRLYFEELLVDLDDGKPQKRDTGKPMPLVEVDTPTPIEDAASGPISLHALEAQLDAERLEDVEAEAEDEHASSDEEDDQPAPGALLGGYRPSSLRLIDEAVAAAQLIEPSLFEDEELAVPATPAPRSGPSVPPPIPAAAGRTESFDHEEPTSIGNVVMTKGVNGVSVQPIPVIDALADDEDSIPREIPRDEPGPPHRPRLRTVSRPPVTEVVGRDDSGLRMIGSLGRDRAEASGELAPAGPPAPTPTETQRELVTILPRRITREVPIVSRGTKSPTVPPPIPAAAKKPTTPTAPVEPPVRPSAQRLEGSGVSRHDTGPGVGPIILFVIAALLGTIAVFVWVKKGSHRRVAEVHDASIDAPQLSVMPLVPDATPATTADAMPGDVRDAGARDAARSSGPDASTVADRNKQARALLQEANNSLQEGKFDDALVQAEGSLKLRRTARGHLARAQALQRLERIDEALSAVDDAVETSATYAPAFELRGRILWSTNRKDEARFAFEQFLALEPDTARAESIRGLLRENR